MVSMFARQITALHCCHGQYHLTELSLTLCINHVVFFWENITDIIPSFWTLVHAVAIKCHKDNMIQQFPPYSHSCPRI